VAPDQARERTTYWVGGVTAMLGSRAGMVGNLLCWPPLRSQHSAPGPILFDRDSDNALGNRTVKAGPDQASAVQPGSRPLNATIRSTSGASSGTSTGGPKIPSRRSRCSGGYMADSDVRHACNELRSC
jgi:hypothetical protein